MTIERPMFPPRAESVDSFSLQPAIGQRENGCSLSESRKPAEGLSRRVVLAGVASAAALPIAGALPTTAAATADPAFALIAAKLAGDAAHGVAIDAVDAAERQYGYDCDNVPDPVEDAYQRSEAACHAVFEADWRLATTPPTTLAGVAAVLRFANAIEDGGMEWPATDTIGREGWHYQLRATMAAAIEALIEAQAGKAVQS
jgi:hypothetical protein